jgi:RimJ/RimL family protein N-acetyltransferase
LIVERSHDYPLIKQIMTEPQIWQEICGNYGDKIEDFEPVVDDYIYLIGYDKLNIIGLFIIHESEYGYQCHVQVVPERRKQYADEFGKKVINWTWSNTDINKLIALIPSKFKNVISFAEKQGFKIAGTIKDDCFMSIER